MYIKAIGSILMILGTSVGAGMLALPVVTANESFSMSFILLVFAWFLMTLGAFSLLEISLWLKPDTNLSSMAKNTLGPWGKLFTWLIYLFLLYSLICAYLSGISGILQGLLLDIHVPVSQTFSTLLSLLLFGSLVYRGIASVDLLNRILMLTKLISYFILVILIAAHINLHAPFQGKYTFQANTFMVMLTSFGYAIIIPSLRTYLKSDRALLIKVILIGSLLPLIIYSIWIFAIQGIIEKTGAAGLVNMAQSSNTTGLLMSSISAKMHTSIVAYMAKLFISICALTSFLGVSVALTDFIADGLNSKKYGKPAIKVYAISYLPPLLIVLIAPNIFINALSYAGVGCLFLLIILPFLMLYAGRYVQRNTAPYILPINTPVLILLILLSLVLLIFEAF